MPKEPYSGAIQDSALSDELSRLRLLASRASAAPDEQWSQSDVEDVCWAIGAAFTSWNGAKIRNLQGRLRVALSSPSPAPTEKGHDNV